VEAKPAGGAGRYRIGDERIISLVRIWFKQVVTGFFAYHAVPTNAQALSAFRHYVTDLWRRPLRRRSQKDGLTWTRMTKIADAWLPKPRILHPWLEQFLPLYSDIPSRRSCRHLQHKCRFMCSESLRYAFCVNAVNAKRIATTALKKWARFRGIPRLSRAKTAVQWLWTSEKRVFILLYFVLYSLEGAVSSANRQPVSLLAHRS
jgi:hypothetical protein